MSIPIGLRFFRDLFEKVRLGHDRLGNWISLSPPFREFRHGEPPYVTLVGRAAFVDSRTKKPAYRDYGRNRPDEGLRKCESRHSGIPETLLFGDRRPAMPYLFPNDLLSLRQPGGLCRLRLRNTSA
jgi:hypothetical protein